MWASLVAQWVKNLPTMQETQKTRVKSLGQEDLLEEGMATHSSILAWRIPWTEEPGGLQVHRSTQSWTQLKWLSTHLFCCYLFGFHFLFDVEFFCMYSEVKSIYIVLLFLIPFLGFWYYGYIRFTKCSWDIFVFLCGLHSLNSIGMICSLKSLWNLVLKPSF